jgi:Cdc6-like AAA superfamily ATPase
MAQVSRSSDAGEITQVLAARKSQTPAAGQKKFVVTGEKFAIRAFSFLNIIVNCREKEVSDLETGDIAAVLKFYCTQTDEVTGRSTEQLSEELLNEVKRFAYGDLSREELERFSAKIASNTPAIEVLAREIKQRWNRDHGPS